MTPDTKLGNTTPRIRGRSLPDRSTSSAVVTTRAILGPVSTLLR